MHTVGILLGLVATLSIACERIMTAIIHWMEIREKLNMRTAKDISRQANSDTQISQYSHPRRKLGLVDWLDISCSLGAIGVIFLLSWLMFTIPYEDPKWFQAMLALFVVLAVGPRRVQDRPS